jgi:hypothetical protein
VIVFVIELAKTTTPDSPTKLTCELAAAAFAKVLLFAVYIIPKPKSVVPPPPPEPAFAVYCFEPSAN